MKVRAIEPFYSVSHTAFLLDFGVAWVRAKVEEGAFPGTKKIDGDYRIPASAINDFLDRHDYTALKAALEDAIPAGSETELKRKIRGRRRGTS